MTFGEADEKSFMHKVGSDEETSFAVLNRALDLGINFIDTADVYGQDGLSERVLAKWFAKHETRNKVVLASKFRFRMGEGPNGTGASRYRIMQTVEDSLRRLGTDRIDLYQIHMQDSSCPEEETLRALDDLVRQGKVLYIGASNYTAYRLTDSLWTSKTQHLEKFATMQMQYSLVCRDLEREHMPLAKKFGMGILPWSPLAGGFLSGKYARGAAAPVGSRMEQWKERYASFDHARNWKILEAVNGVAAETGTSATAVALAWTLARPCVSSVIFGARTLAQLEDNVRSCDLKLSEAQMQTLTEASAFDIGYPYDFMKRIQSEW
jgi:aryl-alcohol dehydrogenase-like predicted oxidoreductase